MSTTAMIETMSVLSASKKRFELRFVDGEALTLDRLIWEALEDVARREGLTMDALMRQLLELTEGKADPMICTFLMVYFRTLSPKSKEA